MAENETRTIPIHWAPGYRLVLGDHEPVVESCRNYSGKLCHDWHRLTTTVGPKGYHLITVFIERRRSQFFLHRVVAKVVHGPCPLGWQVRHLNGSKADNRPENLAYGSPKENQADRKIHGTASIGERHGCAKLTEAKVRTIRERRAGGRTLRSLADEFGVKPQTIHQIVTGKRWAHTLTPNHPTDAAAQIDPLPPDAGRRAR